MVEDYYANLDRQLNEAIGSNDIEDIKPEILTEILFPFNINNQAFLSCEAIAYLISNHRDGKDFYTKIAETFSKFPKYENLTQKLRDLSNKSSDFVYAKPSDRTELLVNQGIIPRIEDIGPIYYKEFLNASDRPMEFLRTL